LVIFHLLHSLGSQGNGVRRRHLGLFHEAMQYADPGVLHEKQNARDAIAGQELRTSDKPPLSGRHSGMPTGPRY
jgi:hypothetical protein